MKTEEIIEYIMTTPGNVNWNVLKYLLDETVDKKGLKKYVQSTPNNMNRQVVRSFFGSSCGSSVVGTAVVGTSVVGG